MKRPDNTNRPLVPSVPLIFLTLLLGGCTDAFDPAEPESGYALQFDGIDDFGKFTNYYYDSTAVTYDALTIELWVKPFLRGTIAAHYGFYRLNFLENGRPKFTVLTYNGPAPTISGSAPLATDRWTHIACTYDNRTEQLKMYINGELEATGTSMTSTDSWRWGPKLGQFVLVKADSIVGDDPTPTLFQGQLDEIRVWSKARTAEEIRATMRMRLSGNEAGLITYYPMEEGEGEILSDHAGTNHGMLKNMWHADSLGNSYRPEGGPTWISEEWPQ